MGFFLGVFFLLVAAVFFFWKFSKGGVPLLGGGQRRSVVPELVIEESSAGRKITVEKSSRLGLFSIRVPLFVSNPTSHEIIISKVYWTLWFSNLTHSGTLSREIVIPPQTDRFEIKLSDVLEEGLLGALVDLFKLASSGVQGFLDGKIAFSVRSGPTPARIFSQAFSQCGFALEIKENATDKPKSVTKFSKDPLTGFLTRQFLEVQFQSLIDTFVPTHAMSVLILDVDNFKSVNDGHGHLLGDEVLRILAKEIQRLLKPEDFAIRYGGDEFVIILQDKGGAEAEQFAQELRTAVSMISLPLETGEFLRFTISIGLAVINVRAPYEQWIKLADDVLRLAKKQGKNRLSVNRRAPEIIL
ncbi:MAG: GGDEF domain-containing protein [Candidatus Omnitrophica bacterium]|nr:GGDEF domain-containing protein [Candidatus Omnitrophota bacterium]